jgi:hypothetical protein
MLIGILSDSHGKHERTLTAARQLMERGADVLIHLGDVETEQVLDALAGYPARLVFGNCDHDVAGLTRYAEGLDLAVDHPMGELAVDGKRIAFTHGDRPRLMDDAVERGVDYLLHGHTHIPRDEREGGVRIINPGALFRTSRYTVALLDPGADALEFVELPRSS